MSDTAIALEISPPPEVEAMAKMSPPQLDAFWDKQKVDEAFNAKLFSGDGNALKILRAYQDHKFNAEEAAPTIIAAAADPSAPQPVPGGANNRSGVSKANEVAGAAHLLDKGVPLEAVGEYELRSADGKPMVSPERFFAHERLYNRCRQTPGFLQHPAAEMLMLTFGMLSTTSRPLPPVPTLGVVK